MAGLDHNSHSPAGIDHQPSAPVLVLVVAYRLSGPRLQVAMELASHDGFIIPAGSTDLNEPLDDAARRIIRTRMATPERYLEQLYSFTAESRVVVGYLALFSSSNESAEETSPGQRADWVNVHNLRLEHGIDGDVLDYATTRLRAKLGYTNIAFNLLPDAFTLSELQLAYEAILDQRLDKRNFRRRMIATNILTKTNEMRRDGSHRPAAPYRFTSQDDDTAYLTPPWASTRNSAANADSTTLEEETT